MGYDDTNDRDIRAKQESEPSSSQAVASPGSPQAQDPAITNSPSATETPAAADADDVRVLPGTGGPDDVGDVDVDPDELNMSGH